MINTKVSAIANKGRLRWVFTNFLHVWSKHSPCFPLLPKSFLWGMRDLLSLTKVGDATPRLGITSIFKNRMIQHIILEKDGAVAELDCQEYG